VLDQLLAKGYRVRGTVRSQRKVDQIRRKYPNAKDQLELFVVEDMQVDGAFDGLLNGRTFADFAESRRSGDLPCC
jgi:hypothetical protein